MRIEDLKDGKTKSAILERYDALCRLQDEYALYDLVRFAVVVRYKPHGCKKEVLEVYESTTPIRAIQDFEVMREFDTTMIFMLAWTKDSNKPIELMRDIA